MCCTMDFVKQAGKKYFVEVTQHSTPARQKDWLDDPESPISIFYESVE